MRKEPADGLLTALLSALEYFPHSGGRRHSLVTRGFRCTQGLTFVPPSSWMLQQDFQSTPPTLCLGSSTPRLTASNTRGVANPLKNKHFPVPGCIGLFSVVSAFQTSDGVIYRVIPFHPSRYAHSPAMLYPCKLKSRLIFASDWMRPPA